VNALAPAPENEQVLMVPVPVLPAAVTAIVLVPTPPVAPAGKLMVEPTTGLYDKVMFELAVPAGHDSVQLRAALAESESVSWQQE